MSKQRGLNNNLLIGADLQRSIKTSLFLINWSPSLFLQGISGHLLWGDICGYIWGRTRERIEVPILLKPYKQAESKQTVNFVKYLMEQCPGQRIVLIWDGASYHKYKDMKAFLKEMNGNLPEEDWPVTCILLAPNSPEQNPVEDIWLQGKNELRNKYYLCNSFAEVKELFVNAIDGKTYNFPKVYQYG